MYNDKLKFSNNVKGLKKWQNLRKIDKQTEQSVLILYGIPYFFFLEGEFKLSI